MTGNNVVAGLAILAVVLSGFAAFNGGKDGRDGRDGITVGANPGPDFTQPTFFYEVPTIGGRVIASSTVATETLHSSDIKGVKLFNAKAAAASTLTFPTAANLAAAGFLPKPGDTAEWLIHASTSVITLAGGTNVTLKSAASSSQIYMGNTGKVTFIRRAATEGVAYDAILTTNY